MKTLVIYKSNTGFTKKYAQWIAQSLSCQAIPSDKATNIDFNSYDTIVFGSWLFAGTLKDFCKYREKLARFTGKKAIFAVGCTKANTPEADKILTDCFTDAEHQSTGLFYLTGGLNYSHMNIFHMIMMKMMGHVMKKQNGIDSAAYKQISQSFDGTDPSFIKPLLSYIEA